MSLINYEYSQSLRKKALEVLEKAKEQEKLKENRNYGKKY